MYKEYFSKSYKVSIVLILKFLLSKIKQTSLLKDYYNKHILNIILFHIEVRVDSWIQLKTYLVLNYV